MEIAAETKTIPGKEPLIYLGFWLIIPFCSFTSHTILPVPPTIVLFLMGLILLAAHTAIFHKIYNPAAVILPLCCILYFFFFQMAIGAPMNHALGVILAIMYFVVVVCYGVFLGDAELETLIKAFINFSVALLIIECIWRFTHPALEHKLLAEQGVIPWIYQYKMGGLMYSDSNGTAIHIVILFFYLVYREADGTDNHNIAKVILLVLLILTFSRAAWISVALGYLYFRFLYGKNIIFYLVNFIFLILLIPFVYKFFIEERIRNDISFRSKFEILTFILDYLKHAPAKDLIFGIGFSNSMQVLNVYAHNFFMVYLIESGILGLALMLLLLVQFVAITRSKAMIIVFPFIIVTLSSTITFTPYLYMIIGLIYLNEKKKAQVCYED